MLKKTRARKSRSPKSPIRKRSMRKSRARKSPIRSMRKSRARKSPIRKRSMRKSRARKSPIRKRSMRKSRARKSPIRRRSIRKSRARKSPIRRRSMRKSRVRKSPIRKSYMRKSRARKSRKCKKSQFRSRKSGYCRKRKCGSGRTRDIVTRLCRNKKSRSLGMRTSRRRKSQLRNNYSPSKSPISKTDKKEQQKRIEKIKERQKEIEKKFNSITKLVVNKDKDRVFNYLKRNTAYNSDVIDDELMYQKSVRELLQKKYLYRCITHNHLENIKNKGYMTSASIDAKKRRQDVSVAEWIIKYKQSQYASTSLDLLDLAKHPICENKSYIIRINLKKFDFDVIIPLPREMMKQHGKYVEKMKDGETYTEFEVSNDNGTVYTEFKDINDPTNGIIDLRTNEVTTNKVYLYPAYDRKLINRWTSGMNKHFNGALKGFSLERKISAAIGLQEVVFCGNIPLNALEIVAEKTNGVGKYIKKDPAEEVTSGKEEQAKRRESKKFEKGAKESKVLPEKHKNKDNILAKKKATSKNALEYARFGSEMTHQPQLPNPKPLPVTDEQDVKSAPEPLRYNWKDKVLSDNEDEQDVKSAPEPLRYNWKDKVLSDNEA